MANISPELYAAASWGQIDTIYQVIEQNPHILEVIDAVPFVHTPLHTAASEGHLEFSMEIMRLKPSFGSKLNEQGYSPIHLALDNDHRNLVRCLVQIYKDLVRVKGKHGVTPLHFVIQSPKTKENMLTLMIDMLKACPDSIQDVDMKNQTALHIALLHENLAAFKHMVNWLGKNTHEDALDLQRSILNWKDSNENTILHIATLKNNKEAVDLLMMSVADIKARNLDGKTALDLARAGHFPMIVTTLSNFMHKSIFRLFRCYLAHTGKGKVSEEHRNAFMIVAGLIVTASYQIVLSPVGGLTQSSSDNGPPNNNNLLNTTSSLNSTAPPGKSVMSRKDFGTVMSLNSYVLFFAVYLILFLMPKAPRKFHFISCLLLVMLLITYFFSLSTITPKGY